MKSVLVSLIFIFTSLSLSYTQVEKVDWDENWPQWRGPNASGVAPEGNPPVEWNEGTNIRPAKEHRCQKTAFKTSDELRTRKWLNSINESKKQDNPNAL